jgi:hypothetical protein
MTREEMKAELDRLREEYVATTVAVLRERERCARIADEGERREGESGQGESGWVARRIREGTP